MLRCVRYRDRLGSRIPLDIQCECFRDKSERKECPSSPDDGHDLGIAFDVGRLTIQRSYVLADPQLQCLALPYNGSLLCGRIPGDGSSSDLDDCPDGEQST